LPLLTDAITFTVRASADVHVLSTIPEDGQIAVATTQGFVIQFSDAIVANTDGERRQVLIHDCGNDRDCSTAGDNARAATVESTDVRYDVDISNYGYVDFLPAAGALALDRMYMVELPEGLVTPTIVSLTVGGVTNGAATQFTAGGNHDLLDGDFVTITGVTGLDVEVNGRFQATVVSPTDFTIPVDTSAATGTVDFAAAAIAVGGLASPLARFEFSTGTTMRFHASNTYEADPAASTATQLVFNVPLGPGVTQANGKYRYTVCLCDEQTDATTTDAAEGATMLAGASGAVYRMTEERECVAAVKDAPPHVHLTRDAMLPEAAVHICSDKCDKGCFGPHCYCDGNLLEQTTDEQAWGYLGDLSAQLGQKLCLPLYRCQEMCDLHNALNPAWVESEAFECVGVDMHATKNMCRLVGAARSHGTQMDCPVGSLTENRNYHHFSRIIGASCTHASDFSEQAGILAVTRRATTGVDYVLEPNGEETSLEVVSANGNSLTVAGLEGLSKDRITVIDCHGSCGVTEPAQSVTSPAEAQDIRTWNQFWPLSQFYDPAHNDTNNAQIEADDHFAFLGSEYTTIGRVFCSGRNLDLDVVALIDGSSIQQEQCYNKCQDGTITGEGCSGYYAGFDGPGSNALCVTPTQLQAFCDSIPSCESYDHHRTLNRGFLNGVGCEEGGSMMQSNENYNWVRREREGAVAARRLQLEVPRYSSSWSGMLRWRGIAFSGAGTYKLCFCDSEHLPGRECMSTSDYAVELGTVHVSGIACLIKDTRFQRAACVNQYHGGVRCYPDAAPVVAEPVMEVLYYSDVVQPDPEVQKVLSTWCMFGPEEQANADPRCQYVSSYQSTHDGAAQAVAGP